MSFQGVKLGWRGLQFPESLSLKTSGLRHRSLPSCSPVFYSDFPFCTVSVVVFLNREINLSDEREFIKRERWHLFWLGEMNLFEFFWDLPIKIINDEHALQTSKQKSVCLDQKAREFLTYYSFTCPGWKDGEWTETGCVERLLYKSHAIQPRKSSRVMFLLKLFVHIVVFQNDQAFSLALRKHGWKCSVTDIYHTQGIILH